MSLSVEIIDHILSFLRGDPESLDVCSAVFPEEVVDRYLYHNIIIPGSSKLANSQGGPPVFLRFNPENLSTHLAKNPRIASYVRTIRILIDRTIHPKLPFILSRLSRVESTTLARYMNHVAWLDLNKRFRTVFLDHLKLPTIRKISISQIDNFPLSAFDKCKNLPELSLVGKFTGGGSPSTSSPCPLQHLEVTPQTSPGRFVSWAKTNALQSLSLNFYDLQYQGTLSFPDILQAFSSTLVSLELNFCQFFCRSPLIPFILPRLEFPLLRCLLVHTTLSLGFESTLSTRITSLSALPATIRLLESMAPNMYHLSLHLQFFDTSIPLTLDWPRSIVTLANIPNIRYPIKLYISHKGKTAGSGVLSAIERDLELEQLTKEAKLQIENGPVYLDSHEVVSSGWRS